MSTLFVIGLVAGVLALARLFATTDPVRLARLLRSSGPLALGLSGLAALLAGSMTIGAILIAAALALYAARARTRAAPSEPGRRSTVRSAALEMELDHDTGTLQGLALAGTHEGKTLARMGRSALLELYAEIAGDSESRQLLEAYLDGRFPGWREDAKPQPGRGERGAPGAGAMTEQEAYQILGLPAGAGAAEIRKAHRRLMQRLNPGLGRSSALAARINEAKDVLLSLHH